MRYTKTELSKTIEKFLDAKARKMKSKNVSRELKAMVSLAKAIDIECACFYTPWVAEKGGRVACICRKPGQK